MLKNGAEMFAAGDEGDAQAMGNELAEFAAEKAPDSTDADDGDVYHSLFMASAFADFALGAGELNVKSRSSDCSRVAQQPGQEL